ncbi:MAG: tripartite tricarboxylate transporter TctB family protein [Limnochordia bacterium]|jgi:putative tricarboxylic transport membrane protein
MLNIGELVLGGASFLLALLVYIHTWSFPQLGGGQPGPALFPQVIAVILGLLGLILIGESLYWARVRASQGQKDREKQQVQLTWSNFFWVVGAVIFYILLSETLGFVITAAVISFVLMTRLGVLWFRALPVSLLLALVIFWLFARGLYVPLPLGVWRY